MNKTYEGTNNYIGEHNVNLMGDTQIINIKID